MERINTKCCIAGGGPAGIMLGYLLARAGIDVVVLEKWLDFFRDFRGDTIHPSTMQILDELDLFEDFLKLPHNEMTRMTLHFGTDAITVADFSHLRVRAPYIAFIPQWDFLNFLSARAKAFPSFHLMMETELTELVSEHGHVVGAVAKQGDKTFEIRAQLVVGADGRHSTARSAGGFDVENLSTPIDVLWFRIGRGDVDDKQSLGYIEAGRALVMLDRREYWQCAFVIEKGSFDRIKAEGLSAFQRSVAELAGLPHRAVAEIDSWDKVKLLSVTVDHARTWAKEGVLLIGDAAHAMSPLGGVGINYAIHDAVAAGNILVPAFKRDDLSLTTLSKVQSARGAAVRRMQMIQVFAQDRVLAPILHANKEVRAPLLLKCFRFMPVLRRITAHVLGIGFHPERVDIAF